MTPVFTMLIELTTVLVVVSNVAELVVIGTSSPTWRRAGWLSSTTRDGEESTFTVVIVDRALMIARGFESGPSNRLKPGPTLERSADCAVVAAAVTTLVVVSDPAVDVVVGVTVVSCPTAP